MFVNYAHRGASDYAPENTMSAFCLGIEMGANGIETDIQLTRDGVAVLFHDDSLARVTGVDRLLSDMSLAELDSIDFGVHICGEKYRGERIVTLSDFMRYFASRPLQLALELKGPMVEQITIDEVNQAGCRERTILTSFELDYLKQARKIDPDIALGYLTDDINDEVLNTLDSLKIRQICPRSDFVTREKTDYAKSRGFSVRAWGLANEQLMENCLAAGVDGMTVNFPDKLAERLKELKKGG